MANPKVLMVDDNEEFLEATSARLELRELAVDTATSGADALKLLQGKSYDVAILDLAMPGISGVETLHKMKEEQPFLQVIMLTGHGSYEAALESGYSHAFKFLEKPVEVDELTSIIYEAHEEKGRQQGVAYQKELSKVLNSFATAQDIVSQTRALQKKYGQ